MASYWANITSKAALALDKAKTQIRELTEENGDRSEELERNCQENLINFKIQVKVDGSDELWRETEQLKQEVEYLNNEIAIAKDDYREKVSQMNRKREKLAGGLQLEIGDLREMYRKSKLNRDEQIGEIYKNVQVLMKLFGLPVPSINSDVIGLEDVQEFIYATVEYINHVVTEISNELSNSSMAILKKTLEIKPNLTGIQEGTLFILEESVSKVNSLEDIKQASEGLYQQVVKELKELQIKHSRELESRETSEEAFKKLSTELRILTQEVEKYEAKADANEQFQREYHEMLTTVHSLTEENQHMKSKNTYLAKELSNTKAENNKLSQELIKYKQLTENNIKKEKALYETINSLTIERDIGQEAAQRVKCTESDLSQYKAAMCILQDSLKQKEQEIEAKSSHTESLLQELEASSQTICSLHSRISELTQELHTLNSSQQLPSQLDFLKVHSMKKEAEDLLSRISENVKDTETLVDKRVVSTFIVNLLSPSSSDKVKHQMLSTLSNLLDFDTAQKLKVGLAQQNTLFTQLASFISRG